MWLHKYLCSFIYLGWYTLKVTRKNRQRNLQQLLELPLRRLFPPWSKQRKPLNVWRRTTLVKWKPSQVLPLVWWSLAAWCWPSWNRSCRTTTLTIRFGRKPRVWWTSPKSFWKECSLSTAKISSRVFWTQSTKLLKILPKSTMKRTQPPNFALGLSTSSPSTESSKKSSLCKSQRTKLPRNSSRPWSSWLRSKNKCENSTKWWPTSDRSYKRPKTRRNWWKTMLKDAQTS